MRGMLEVSGVVDWEKKKSREATLVNGVIRGRNISHYLAMGMLFLPSDERNRRGTVFVR